MNEIYREEAKKWEALYDEVYDALSNEIDRDSQGELETLGQCAKRIIKERNELIAELKEYRSIAENIGAEKETLKQLSQWEDLVFSHQEDFEKEFCSDNELLGLWFGSEWVKIWYMHSEGIHYTNSFPIKIFLEFVEKYERHIYCKN
jgi:hypothetical protein